MAETQCFLSLPLVAGEIEIADDFYENFFLGYVYSKKK